MAASPRRLWSAALDARVLPLPPITAGRHAETIASFDGRRMRLWTQRLDFPDPHGGTLVAAVAAPVDDMATQISEFSMSTWSTLGVLGIGLIAAAAFQIRMGIAPLRRLGMALADIRAGRRARLPETFPDEVSPVVHELNAHLDYNQAFIEKARAQTADMAHSLKNPLSVIRNDIRKLEGPTAARLARMVDSVISTIENQLARSRTAGTANLLNASAAVGVIVEDLLYSLRILYRDRNLQFRISGLAELRFRGDPQDLEELLGALLDNACKFADQQVELSGRQVADRIVLTITDDGPGMPEEIRRLEPRRGRRLDSTFPGTGLGLSIAADLAQLYGGNLALEEAIGGGLAVIVALPAVVA